MEYTEFLRERRRRMASVRWFELAPVQCRSEADPKEAKRQHLRDFLANIMETDRGELSSLIKHAQ